MEETGFSDLHHNTLSLGFTCNMGTNNSYHQSSRKSTTTQSGWFAFFCVATKMQLHASALIVTFANGCKALCLKTANQEYGWVPLFGKNLYTRRVKIDKATGVLFGCARG